MKCQTTKKACCRALDVIDLYLIRNEFDNRTFNITIKQEKNQWSWQEAMKTQLFFAITFYRLQDSRDEKIAHVDMHEKNWRCFHVDEASSSFGNFFPVICEIVFFLTLESNCSWIVVKFFFSKSTQTRIEFVKCTVLEVYSFSAFNFDQKLNFQCYDEHSASAESRQYIS